jgi:hypothetical protein
MSAAAGSKNYALLAVLLVALTLIAYVPAMRGGFVWDDDDYVTENGNLHSMAGLERIWFEIGAVPQYYPLVHTTFWIEYHLWGLRPLGFHVTNVLLHALNGLILWELLRRLGIPGAWGAAALFVLHPLQVESVAWVTERKNVLSLAPGVQDPDGDGNPKTHAYVVAGALGTTIVAHKTPLEQTVPGPVGESRLALKPYADSTTRVGRRSM